MLTLSLPSVARATVQPPSTGPTTSSSGTNTSLKNTSLNSECAGRHLQRPHLDALGLHVDHHRGDARRAWARRGWCARWPARSLATWAPLVQTFWPLTSQPPSTRVALVLMPAASEPASGSLNSWHQMTSWSQRGRHPAGDLVVGAVLDEREDDPAGDAVRRAGDAGRGELLLDHELLDRAGLAAPRLGPVRHRRSRSRSARRAASPASSEA